MKIIPHPRTIYSIINRKSRINPKPQYQRCPVWGLEKKQRLIDSILRGYDIPKFYLRNINSTEFESEILDGQQRLRSIWEFREGSYTLGDISCDLPIGDLSGKSYDDLTSDQQDAFGSYELTIAELLSGTEEEVRDLFLRLQEGTSLNPAEKRNAMMGDMRDSIDELSGHSILAKTTMSNNRFEYADWISHIVCIELNDGPTDVKAEDLKRLYENNKNFDSSTKNKIKKVKRVLNYMNKVFTSPSKELKIKWGFVDLYLLISKLIDVYDISDRECDFLDFYRGFEEERRKYVSDPSELISSGRSCWDRDLYDYIIAFQKEGAKRHNIEKRHKVYISKFLNQFPDLVPKDHKRLFNDDEKLVIWRNANMKCESCNIPLDLKDIHADHKVPHSKGGQTIISNSQCLCGSCNLSKGAKL